MNLESPEYAARKPISHTDLPQPKPEDEGDEAARMGKVRKSLSNLKPAFELEEDPQFFEKIRKKFSNDYEACFYIAKNISEKVDPSLQEEYYSGVRTILAMHPRSRELTDTMTLAWFDYHYAEEPSRLLTSLGVMQREDLPHGKEALALVLSLMQSGFSSKDEVETLGRAVDEILSRRSEFKKRILAGAGVELIALEDSPDFSARSFTDLAKKITLKSPC